jgi:NAD(P)-dependent dehydrogenase (short-subunit alcohol dehydrogenase family)
MGGRVINIASINAFIAGQNIGGRHYESAKAAIVQFTLANAADWAALVIDGGYTLW